MVSPPGASSALTVLTIGCALAFLSQAFLNICITGGGMLSRLSEFPIGVGPITKLSRFLCCNYSKHIYSPLIDRPRYRMLVLEIQTAVVTQKIQWHSGDRLLRNISTSYEPLLPSIWYDLVL